MQALKLVVMYPLIFLCLTIIISTFIYNLLIYLLFMFSAKEDINSVSQAFELATLRALKGVPEGTLSTKTSLPGFAQQSLYMATWVRRGICKKTSVAKKITFRHFPFPNPQKPNCYNFPFITINLSLFELFNIHSS